MTTHKRLLPNTWEKALPFAALSISILALIATIFSAWQTRVHNRLTVKPALAIYGNFRSDDETNGFFLQNKGTGPAIIKRYDVFLDGQKLDDYKHESLRDLHRKVGLEIIGGPLIVNFTAPHPLAAGEELSLYEYRQVPQKSGNDQAKHDLNNRLRFKIEYCSVYEECWTLE